MIDNDNNLSADQAMVSVLNKSEIEQQITTAHKFPRDISRFVKRSMDLVGLNEETASQCLYALPRDGKVIEGPSARFAEIIANTWGNCRAGARVIDDTGKFIVSQGVFHDLEANTSIVFEVQRRVTNKQGHRFKDDMIGVTGNAASSIALRNAILKGVPKALWQPIYEHARKTAMGDVKTLSKRRDDALAYALKMGVPNDRVFATLEVSGPEGIDNEKLLRLRSIFQAVIDGDSNVDDAFGLNERAPAASLNGKLKDAPEPEGVDGATAAQDASGPTPTESATSANQEGGSPESAAAAKAQEQKTHGKRKSQNHEVHVKDTVGVADTAKAEQFKAPPPALNLE